MNPLKIFINAARSILRNKMRTFFTVAAIVVGAFVLTLTTAVGTGINNYIDTQLDAIGGENVMDVRNGTEEEIEQAMQGGLQEYDPDAAKSGTPSPLGLNLKPFTQDEINKIQKVDGIESVRPVYFVSASYIGFGKEKYVPNINVALPGDNLEFMAGGDFTDQSKNGVILTEEYVEVLGFDSNEDAIGETIEFGADNAIGEPKTLTAEVVGVQKPTLIDLGLNVTENVRESLYGIQQDGLGDNVERTYIQAQATFAADATDEEIQHIKDNLDAEGFYGITVKDQIGSFKTIIDVIVTVLNGFAVIGLINAGFCIVITLFMSVKERTREIGLMKAMGLSSAKVFALFSTEALLIGLLGAAAGVGLAMAVGTVINIGARSALEALGGINIILFDPLNVLAVVGIVLGIAFIASAAPALSAARQNPIEALRYE